ncbi:MAG: type III pantothenate kinase [Gemmatimonadales bacterium]
MILAIDVGNTETVLGVLDGLETVRSWRLATERGRTSDELTLLVRGFLHDDGLPDERPAGAVVASVVPVLDRAWEGVCSSLGFEVVFLTAGSADRIPIRLDVDEPFEVGADRLANTLAIAERSRNAIVVDVGTATTFDCITAEGVFLGGVIAPGPLAGMERLSQAASKLMQVDVAPPERVIGRNTIACLGSGVFYSVVDAIDGIVRRILAEWRPGAPLVIGTGGLADLIAPHCETIERVEPHLTLQGLAIAGRHLLP